MKKLCVVLALILAALCAVPCFAENGPGIASPSAILVDLDTGKVVYEKDADIRYTQGTLSKVMTALLVLEKCEDLSVETAVSKKAHDYTTTATPNAFLEVGETFTVDELLSMLMVRSGTDVAAVLAEHIAGGWDAFVAMANQKAQDLGCTNTYFKNASGRETTLQYTSARDMVLILQEALKDPRFMPYAKKITFAKGTHAFRTSNGLVDPLKTDYYYEAASGVAFSQLDSKENHIVTVINKGGKQYACAVLGGTKTDNLIPNFADVKALGEWVATAFKTITLGKAGTIVGDTGILFCEKTDRANLVLAETVSLTVPSDVVETVIVESIEADTLQAPKSAGETVGKIKYYYRNELLAESNLELQMDYAFSESLKKQYEWKQFTHTSTYALIVVGIVLLIIIGVIVAGYFLLKRNGHTYGDMFRIIRRIIFKKR